MKLTHIILISVTGLALLISVGWLFAKDRFSPSHALSHLIGKKSVSDVKRILWNPLIFKKPSIERFILKKPVCLSTRNRTMRE